MSRYTGPKNRIARKYGANIFTRSRNPLIHKPNPPGMHGAKRKKKSDFGQQLEEKQKLRAIYGMLSNKQLIRIYNKAVKMEGPTPHNFLTLLECRLDNIVYRLRIAPTIFSAQQMISHGHIFVNGKKVDKKGFLVEPGMTISVKAKSQKMKLIKASLENTFREVPEYLELDTKQFSGKLASLPLEEQVPLPILINIPLVCEFIAHTS